MAEQAKCGLESGYFSFMYNNRDIIHQMSAGINLTRRNTLGIIISTLILSSSVLGVLALLFLPELPKSSASTAPSTCVSFNEQTSTIVISCDATF